eukprot:CAMPEP_0178991252 /NCGR_PEP_ID=MMETSP0795-20121207/5415_1 /TAXON_ID=88552 /ORGANISM="Amoebophrya sp., Strain Ameob2" /LENGTH=136 /DNA_ID=CAMNT_0020682921 /DNA_START=322 /DNA_END=732 /DNA_ORIENTATION=-
MMPHTELREVPLVCDTLVKLFDQFAVDVFKQLGPLLLEVRDSRHFRLLLHYQICRVLPCYFGFRRHPEALHEAVHFVERFSRHPLPFLIGHVLVDVGVEAELAVVALSGRARTAETRAHQQTAAQPAAEAKGVGGL